MAYFVTTTRCAAFKEFTAEERKKWFSVTRDKVIFNIDTLYYTVYLKENPEKIDPMLDNLKFWHDEYMSGNKDITYYDMQYAPFHFCHYDHLLRIENLYDIFISSYLPNENTPRIVVQLRSYGLWVKGVEEMLEESLSSLYKLLDTFDIKIDMIKVNRIDYAFHNNLIQNTARYLNDTVLKNNLKSKMRIYQKVGKITDTVEVDYLCLGNRKSNNIFFRTYNKSREVVEKSYKAFFIERWYNEGLISAYDKYCLEVGYKRGSYTAMNIARIDWYLEYGHNEQLKKRLKEIRRKCFEESDNYTYIKQALRNVLPEVTIITNVEFQTKSKFFKTAAEFLNQIPLESLADVRPEAVPVYKIVRNSRIFTDYLTSDTVAFCEKNNEYMNWWQRIRQCKVNTMFKGELLRKYGNGIDMERLKQRMVTALAGMSAYKNNINSQDLTADVSDFLCVLNDNDVCAVTLNERTGELLEYKYKNYEEIKRRKQRQLKPLLEKLGM